ncbi:diphosphomevalonate decarboxylase [Candidatus Gottesmanbacteria bacterium]|nr:diphosphomevalonate decarboxylase [Candidatus Gottesmanbacteria bacterium]
MVTAVAPANIAFIKYWGKRDEALRLPWNDSISMNLSEAYTTTTVEFSPRFTKDEVEGLEGEEVARVSKHLDRLRKLKGNALFAHVETKNTFPKGSGIASSASGFAALTLAAAKALDLSFDEKELSILARIGSGSACRSIPDGFVEWKVGESSEDSYAYSLYPSDYWDLCDVLVIVASSEKNISSTKGHEAATSSPFFHARVEGINERIEKVKEGLKKKDLGILGPAIEEEAINMHAVMMSQTPSLFYWSGKTMDIIQSVIQWRDEGLPVYFTIDAGPNVHLICEANNAQEVSRKVRILPNVESVVINKPAQGAHLV